MINQISKEKCVDLIQNYGHTLATTLNNKWSNFPTEKSPSAGKTEKNIVLPILQIYNFELSITITFFVKMAN